MGKRAALWSGNLVNSVPVSKGFVIAAMVVAGQVWLVKPATVDTPPRPLSSWNVMCKRYWLRKAWSWWLIANRVWRSVLAVRSACHRSRTITAPDGSHMALVIGRTPMIGSGRCRRVPSIATRLPTRQAQRTTRSYTDRANAWRAVRPTIAGAGRRRANRLRRARGGHVLVTLVNTTLRFEVLTDPAALAARRDGGHDADLVAASHALDSSDATGERRYGRHR